MKFWQKNHKITKKISVIFCLFLTSCFHQKYYSGPKSDHFDGNQFISEDKTKIVENFVYAFTPKGFWTEPAEKINSKKPAELLPNQRARVTFIGHSTFLIQFPIESGVINILTDPIWSERAGPIAVPLLSPKRHNPPAINFEDLTKIDFVLISHSSYFHMDLPTIKKLQQKFAPKFITGLGNCHVLNKIKKLNLNCLELDWEQTQEIGNELKITFLPTKNWSKRSWFDTNKTLWGSFLIKNPSISIYFAGDSGYSNHFQQIKSKFGSPDVAMLPIGSYKPKWYFGDHHLSPEDAVMAHRELGAKKSIGMHFKTFKTSSENYFEPVEDLQNARLSFHLKDEEFVAPNLGEIFDF